MSSFEFRHLSPNHNDTDTDNGDINLAKGLAMAVLFLTSFVLGVLPIKLYKWFSWNKNAKDNIYVKMLLGFGGGVLLCTTFLHLLPEVAENFENVNLTPNINIHYAELLMCVGFFLMYLVEECVHLYLHQKQKNKNVELITRSLSIRRGETECNEKTSGEKKSVRDYGSTIYNNNHNWLSHSGHNLSNPFCVEHSQVDHACADHSHTDHSRADHSHTDHSHVGHSHADHSHVVLDVSDNSTIAIIRGLLVVLALAVHELFEGLSIGLENSSNHVWYMFGAVSAHKLVIAFCIGIELVSSGLKNVIIVIYIFTFAIVSPIGIGIGLILTNEGESPTTLASVFLQGLASGTLLYVIFFEILQSDKKHGLKQYCAILSGFVIMFCMTLID